MEHQPYLWDLPSAREPDTLQARFEVWLADNAHIYWAFREAALNLKRRGRTRIGMKHLAEELRWNSGLYSIGTEFKIDNNFTSRIARKLLEDCPELEGFLELRKLQRE